MSKSELPFALSQSLKLWEGFIWGSQETRKRENRIWFWGPTTQYYKMYSSPVPSPPWSPNHASPPTTPTSPNSRRRRGLSYLRSYTQSYILSRDSQNNHSHSHSQSSPVNSPQRPSILSRASYPSPTSSPGRSAPAAAQNIPRQTSPTAQRSPSNLPSARSSNPEISGSTSGWLPTGTVRGHR